MVNEFWVTKSVCVVGRFLYSYSQHGSIYSGLYSCSLGYVLKFLYYIKNQKDATLAVLFISNSKITLHISDAFCVHHQEY